MNGILWTKWPDTEGIWPFGSSGYSPKKIKPFDKLEELDFDESFLSIHITNQVFEDAKAV